MNNDHWKKAQAYHNTYALFSRLYLHGPKPEIQAYLRAIPELGGQDYDESEESISADHYQLFGLNVLPFASLFLGWVNMLGGEVTDRVLAFYAEARYDPAGLGESADHISQELSFLSFLCGVESDAQREDLSKVVARIQFLQRRFIDEHLLWWLPGFVKSVQRHGQPFYTHLASLTLDTAIYHRASLGDNPGDYLGKQLLPAPPDLLEDPDTGIKEIADFLLTHSYSGLYLSRKDIENLARQHGLPRGFGSRREMLANLLYAAVDHDRLTTLLKDLMTLIDQWQEYYAGLSDSEGLLGGIAGTWRSRLAATKRLVERIVSVNAM